MKLKFSNFTILFLVLNSLLIFCATSNIDSEKEPSSSLTNTNSDTKTSSDDNLDTHINSSSNKNTPIIVKPSLGLDYPIIDNSTEELKANIKVSVEDVEDSDEQKNESIYSTLKDSISKEQVRIVKQFHIKSMLF